MSFNVGLFNVILTGVAFLFLFTAFQTASQASQNVLEAAAKESGQNVGVGYVSLSILYAAFSVSNWFAAVVVKLLGPKYTMFLGALCYLLFVATFMEPRAWSLYLGSIVNGFGAAVLWTAQGALITSCSTGSNVARNFGIFWGLFQFSQVVGGLYVYLSLAGISTIDRQMRLQLFGGLLVCGGVGCLLFLVLRPPSKTQRPGSEFASNTTDLSHTTTTNHGNTRHLCKSAVQTFCRSFHLLPSKVMLCLLLACGFTGVNTTFLSSLFASCIGHTLAFGDNVKAYIGLMVVFVGLGEIVGSGLVNLRRWIDSYGLVSIFGYTGALIGAFLCFIMLPANSPIQETHDFTYVSPNLATCMFVAALFGMVDAVWNTQISVLIGRVYGRDEEKDDVPVVFALYRCVQSVMAAITFAYCDQLLLHWHVLLYVLWASAGVAGFFYVHWVSAWTHCLPSATPLVCANPVS
ncbi:hypothetical protein EG68_08265 [Paragonimus skrjabini miyazakii]|uniref:UNC93-like protein MFSD11 n=1 Tax=Paragonimus skrjabini miyazakii TaxID=59628 RepID=A0A8S9YPA7_9TREM|nr:hypothetical protein EG68_08265 [Paragonimus skrjabini miyazakii]